MFLFVVKLALPRLLVSGARARIYTVTGVTTNVRFHNPMNTTSDHSINVLDDNIRRQIAGAIAEVDPAQMAITRKLTSAQRFQQMLSMIDFVEGVATHRLRLRQSELSKIESVRIIRRRHVEL